MATRASHHRRVPVLASAVVALAVALMIGLGFWQLQRLGQKQALLARYAAAQVQSDPVEWPADPQAATSLLYRHSQLTCTAVRDHSSIAGRNRQGESGVSQTATCALPGGGSALVVIGWSRSPNAGAAWQGGDVWASSRRGRASWQTRRWPGWRPTRCPIRRRYPTTICPTRSSGSLLL